MLIEEALLKVFFSVLFSLLAGRLLFFELKPIVKPVLSFIERYRKKHERKPVLPYSERIETLTSNLTNASSEVDRILQEMTEIAHQRAGTISQLEAQLLSLSKEEQGLQERIKSLEEVPIPAVEHFLAEIKKGENRKARRDYALFGLGVFVSTGIAILLKVIFGI